ncbi:MAG: CinA family protein [Pseudomonadota bacterium]
MSTHRCTERQPPARADKALVQLCRFMSMQSLVLSTAESCTAGLMAARLADVPGAGSLLDCAFVVYSPQAKQRVLRVSGDTLARCNLTSEEVAREMAQGVLHYTHANVIIANTGVTDNTDPTIPAGTQWFAWLFRGSDGSDRLFSETRRFSGDRNQIREDAAVYALMQIPELHARLARD